jgi:hypothetical protein
METDADDAGSAIESTIVTAEWTPFKQEGKEALLSYIDFYVDTDQKTTMQVEFYKDNEISPYATQTFDMLPNLSFVSTIQSISKANPCNVNSAQSGLVTGQQVYIYGVLGMRQVNGGPYTVTVVDENNITLNGVDSSAYDTYLGSGQVVLLPYYKTKVWKRVFAGGIGTGHSLRLTSVGTDAPFTISAFKPYFKPRGNRTVN